MSQTSQSMLGWSVDVKKIMRLVILSDMLLNPSFKIQLAQVNLYIRKDFKSLAIGSLCEK